MSAGLPPELGALTIAWVVAVGAVVGSFLNVVVARVPAGESIVRPASRCPRCKTPIRWYDNVPVLSWILLRGRCRSCRERISVRYPILEASGAAIALVVFARHGFAWSAAAELAFACTLLALALIDLDTWLLPHVLTWPVIGSGLLLSLPGLTPAGSFHSSAYGAVAGFVAFASVAWIGKKLLQKEALGFGDVWLVAGFGAWMGTAALLPIVLLGSLQGSIVGILLIVLGKAQPGPAEVHPGAGADASPDADDPWIPPRNAVPFGPFLVAGALEWLWAGDLLARLVPALAVFR